MFVLVKKYIYNKRVLMLYAWARTLDEICCVSLQSYMMERFNAKFLDGYALRRCNGTFRLLSHKLAYFISFR